MAKSKPGSRPPFGPGHYTPAQVAAYKTLGVTWSDDDGGGGWRRIIGSALMGVGLGYATGLLQLGKLATAAIGVGVSVALPALAPAAGFSGFAIGAGFGLGTLAGRVAAPGAVSELVDTGRAALTPFGIGTGGTYAPYVGHNTSYILRQHTAAMAGGAAMGLWLLTDAFD